MTSNYQECLSSTSPKRIETPSLERMSFRSAGNIVGEVNLRLLAEAVKWLSNSGVTLKPDSELTGDLSSPVTSLNFLYDEEDSQGK